MSVPQNITVSPSGGTASGPRLPRWLGALLNPTTAVTALLFLALVLLVVLPLWQLFATSLFDRDGNLTIGNYLDAFGRARYIDAFWNSMKLGFWVTVMCVIMAVPLAWGVSRTNLPGRGAIRILVLCAFVMPPYLGAVGWILLAGPNAGWINQAYVAITGATSGIVDIYTFSGLAFVIAIYTFPFIFIFTSAALDVVSSDMEDASNILGAGTWKTATKVTIPLVLPAILGGAIITFLEAIALVGTPALIAIPARINLITTQLQQFFAPPIRVEVAAAYTVPLLLITVLLFQLQQRIIARKGFVAMTGKGGERRLIDLGPWRWVLFGYAALIISLALILPCIVLAQAAFAKAWGQGWSLSNLTLANFEYLLFQHRSARESIVNSFIFAGASATLAVVVALGIAYIVERKLTRVGGLLSFLCLAPFVIPGIVLAIAFYATYAPPPFALYGTMAIMILAFTTRFLPIGYTSASASIRSINPEMEEAVRVLGGGRGLAIRKVVAPLMKRSLIGAWLLVFIPATRELSTAIFLYGPHTRPMAIMLLDLSEEGYLELLSALGFLLIIVTYVIVAIGMRLVGRDFMLKREQS